MDQQSTPHEIDDQVNQCILHTEQFEGPLDVLWNLIRKAKIDITDISLSMITEQYLAFLKEMEDLNVRVASEFIWMASELLYYKSKALLPSDALEDEYFTPPLPPELIAKLLEYKKYQQSSKKLLEMYDFQSETYSRYTSPDDIGESSEYTTVSLFDLLKAFADVLEYAQRIEQEEIVFDEILVSDRIQYIAERLKEKEHILFHEIFESAPTRPEVIATFLAILEMSKTSIIKLYQHATFGEIRLARNFSIQETH